MEKKGYIKEYTVMPDFVKLGYSIVALPFSKLRKLNLEELEKAVQLQGSSISQRRLPIAWK